MIALDDHGVVSCIFMLGIPVGFNLPMELSLACLHWHLSWLHGKLPIYILKLFPTQVNELYIVGSTVWMYTVRSIHSILYCIHIVRGYHNESPATMSALYSRITQTDTIESTAARLADSRITRSIYILLLLLLLSAA
jgi:hypothetical protein